MEYPFKEVKTNQPKSTLKKLKVKKKNLKKAYIMLRVFKYADSKKLKISDKTLYQICENINVPEHMDFGHSFYNGSVTVFSFLTNLFVNEILVNFWVKHGYSLNIGWYLKHLEENINLSYSSNLDKETRCIFNAFNTNLKNIDKPCEKKFAEYPEYFVA